jgi:putative deoxyuridine 5'-triphosphate nucleotidohydrolase
MRRYFEKNETIFYTKENKPYYVKEINVDQKTLTAVDAKGNVVVDNLWYFNHGSVTAETVINMTKFRETAKPFKKAREEDAGYDVWLDIPKDYVSENGVKVWKEDGTLKLFLYRNHTYLLPTGIGVAVPSKFWCDFKHERGSTGKLGLNIQSGVVDSGYRGEVFLVVTPLDNNIIITNEVEEVQEINGGYLYPYSKAISQMILQKNYSATTLVVDKEEFDAIPSERGDKALGSTN